MEADQLTDEVPLITVYEDSDTSSDLGPQLEQNRFDLLSTLEPEPLSDWAREHGPNNFDHIKDPEARDRVAHAILKWRSLSPEQQAEALIPRFVPKEGWGLHE